MTTKNVEPLFNAIQSAKAPPKFTQRFLEDLGFKSTNDRLFINLFKALGLLTADGSPTPRYYEFMDQPQSARVLAEALEDAYADLFRIRKDAQALSRSELKGKIKTLTQGQYSDNVVDKMALTFLELAKHADFESATPRLTVTGETEVAEEETGSHAGNDGVQRSEPADAARTPTPETSLKLGGFVYNIELHLPESRDPAVYEALFRSLKSHLLS